jgi:hypothetical protein
MTINGVLLDHHYSHLPGVIKAVWSQLDLTDLMMFFGARILTFADERLEIDTDDRSIWQHCQSRRLLLLTDNRSSKSATSLQNAIDELLEPDSLPVVTPGRRDRLDRDREYQATVMESLADLISSIPFDGDYLGIGRVYLPLDHDRKR